ncbi:class I fructose-bisphosphate aldolase [Abditibacterium utsteinense]|nr:class I fructose-bisphosphate aldolase [Abditibacterium utsteinense]
MNLQKLENTASALLAPGKGILAADESLATIEKRFKLLGIESNAETRRAYREMLFSAPGCEPFLSGVILFDETLRDQTSNGTPFPQFLTQKGILPGIKVDAGAHDMALFPGEKVTEGLDGLRERLGEYRTLGARFAKWRAVITIGDGLPSSACLEANAQALARYAALCQEAEIVPIIEPEVIMDGDHSIEECEAATERALRATFAALVSQGILLEGMLLKPNMVLAGKDATASIEPVSAEEVARRTLGTLRRAVPAAVPGIVFLSGGQPDRDATARLNAMNSLKGNAPWKLTFSFARALQDEAMKLWDGEAGNVNAAQHAFAHRLRLNSAARSGQYRAEMEDAASP